MGKCFKYLLELLVETKVFFFSKIDLQFVVLKMLDTVIQSTSRENVPFYILNR